jgi:hypothetical protein
VRGEHMKKFRAGIGESDFRTLRESGFDIVDKTAFISEVLEDASKVLLFPRPRRFGKTTNLSMLGHFLRKTSADLSHVFEGLEVSRDERAMKHFQKYPVIAVSFKDVKAKTWPEARAGIVEQIASTYRAHRSLFDKPIVDDAMRHKFQQLLAGELPDNDLAHTFKWLSQALYEYHGERVVILIDEYDTPLHTGYLNGYFDEIATFFRTFFSACLKDNNALFKGVLTGILRVAKENMFSDLNHIAVYSILDRRFATSFGFTEDEVRAIVRPERLEEVRAWYNGYLFGGQVIYNPWSIINYVRDELLQPYWVNTASPDLIEKLALKEGMALSDKSFALLNGGTIETQVQTNVVLRDIERVPNAFWNFLLFAGYLKPLDLRLEQGKWFANLAIPNEEIRIVYQDLFHNWLQLADPQSYLTESFVKALLSGHAPEVQENLEQILLRSMSFFDGDKKEPEALYHGFMLGLLVHLEKQYAVRSQPESGYGRVDVMMRPKTPGRPGVVMEFKAMRRNKTLDDTLLAAANQVRDKHYADELVTAGISPVYEYAMVFDGKRATVKLVDDVLKKKLKTTGKKAKAVRTKR